MKSEVCVPLLALEAGQAKSPMRLQSNWRGRRKKERKKEVKKKSKAAREEVTRGSALRNQNRTASYHPHQEQKKERGRRRHAIDMRVICLYMYEVPYTG